MNKPLLIIAFMVFVFSGTASAARDSQGNNNGWISLGTPNYVHIGTDGRFYIQGNDQGKCASVKPTYFRVDMTKAHFDEFYSWLLLMSAQKKYIECVVTSGCGSSQVYVDYCRGAL